MKPLVIGVGSVLLVVVLLLVFSGPEQPSDRTAETSGADVLTPPPAAPPAPAPPAPASQPITLLPIAHTLEGLNHADSTPNEDLLLVESLLQHYRRHFGGNPVGDNDEIVAALRGRNPKSLAYLPADFPALDPTGQLLDRWGTPYRFHALSGAHMEILSAGPDREFWTPDDLVHSPHS